MRSITIDKNFFIINRNKFISFLDKTSLAIFNNNIFNHNIKTYLNLNNDIFYITGIQNTNILLVLFPGYNNKLYREILFIERNSKKKYIWHGNYLSKIDIYKIS